MAAITLQLLWILLVPVLADIDMEFTKYPEPVWAPVDDVVTFECAVSVPGERLAWRWKPDVDDAPWSDVREPHEGNNGISSRLTIHVKENKEGYYQCVAWYGAIVLASVPAKLTVARIDLGRNTAEKRVITAPLHNNLVLHCRAPLSEPPAVLTWWKEDRGKKKQIDTPHGVLIINDANAQDSGSYGCTATNELSGQVYDLPEKIYLKVQHEETGGERFLETEDYVGTIDKEGVLTMPVRPNKALHLWCGVVGSPQPKVTWKRNGGQLPGRAKFDGVQLTVPQFQTKDEGIYSCTAGSLRRAWNVMALQPSRWEGTASNVNSSEGGKATVSCGTPVGQPPPTVYWLLNGEPVTQDHSIRTSGSDLFIDRVEKKHASIVQCFACNELGCAYDAALLTVVPVQITDQEYSVETGRTPHFPSQPPKRHYRKNSRKHANKAVLVPPSRPNVTRMSDESVMVSWSNGTDGLPILFFKVQYKEAMNTSNSQWNTCNMDIPPHVHSYQINGLIPDRYYKFRISAVYSNQDNKQGKSTGRFFLQRGGFRSPKGPVLVNATAVSSTSIMLNWTWSSGGGVQAEGFYVYYRAISSAGEYIKVTAPGGAAARSIVLSHLTPDTGYEVKVQSYTALAPSEFSSILTAKTQRVAGSVNTTEAPSETNKDTSDSGGSGTLLTAGGAGAAILVLLVLGLVLCRRVCRPHRDKEKVSVPEGGSANGYMPAKVPITITANPMHAEGSDGSVEMTYMHNNNTGNEDNTMPHTRKNGSASRRFV